MKIQRSVFFEVAKELGWNQNLLVQSLQTGTSQDSWLFLFRLLTPYWADVLSGVHQQLTER